MHIQVMTATGPNGLITHENHVTGLQNWMSENVGKHSTVHADAYGAAGLIEILEVCPAKGDYEILVLECSKEHIQAVLEWQSATDEVAELESLILHLVRKVATDQKIG